jgi:hydroxypyruvate reductase
MSVDPQQLLRELFATAIDAAHPASPRSPSAADRAVGSSSSAPARPPLPWPKWSSAAGRAKSRPGRDRYGHGAPAKSKWSKRPGTGRRRPGWPKRAGTGQQPDRRRPRDLPAVGGGSALLALPAEGPGRQAAINKALLKSGATIGEMNCVRKHLSAIKGGRLANAGRPRSTPMRFPMWATSPRSSPPAPPWPTEHLGRRLAILKRWHRSAGGHRLAEQPESETVKPATSLARSHFQLIARPSNRWRRAAESPPGRLQPLILGDLEGESREVAKVHAGIAGRSSARPAAEGALRDPLRRRNRDRARQWPWRAQRRVPAQPHRKPQGLPGVYALAGDTDGIDGSEEDNAGAIMTPDSYARAAALGLSASDELDNNNGYGYFAALDALIVTEPTRTNVNDFRAILILETAQS